MFQTILVVIIVKTWVLFVIHSEIHHKTHQITITLTNIVKITIV